MKRAGQVALLLLAICLTAMPVFAATTTLTTSVPHNVNVDVTIEGHGVVAFGDVVCKAPGVIEIPRSGNITITATPDNGWMLQSAMIDGEDFTDRLQEGGVTLENVAEDFTMHIEFRKTAKPPQTGDVFHPEQWFIVAILSLMCIAICVMAYKKKKL